MKFDLSELNGLSETDLQQIDQWLDEFSYRKTARLASQKFNRPIGKRTIERFANRAAPKDFLDDSPEAQETATQILQFAASGQAKFDEASVHVLEQTVFKLTFVCTRRKEDMQALNQISTMLFRHRNAAVRERTASVQEQKVKLREREIILKETIATANMGRAGTRPASEGASREQSPKEPSPKNPWEMNEEEKAAWFKSINKVKSEEAIERDWLKVGMDRKIYRQYLAAIPNPTTEDREAAQRACIIRPKNESTPSSAEETTRACPETSAGSGAVSLSLLKGPLSAEQTSLDGHLTCGGVGNSLGQGQGSPRSPQTIVQPGSVPLSLPKGPLSAEQTPPDGHPTCGGLGNSLGHGEGSSPSETIVPSESVPLSFPKGEGQGEGSPQSQIKNQKSKNERSRPQLHSRSRRRILRLSPFDHSMALSRIPSSLQNQIHQMSLRFQTPLSKSRGIHRLLLVS
jgi:hypothetical protein